MLRTMGCCALAGLAQVDGDGMHSTSVGMDDGDIVVHGTERSVASHFHLPSVQPTITTKSKLGSSNFLSVRAVQLVSIDHRGCCLKGE